MKQHDSLACAVALGWQEGIEVQELPLTLEEKGGLLVEHIDTAGRPARVVTRVDGERFNEMWADRVTGNR